MPVILLLMVFSLIVALGFLAAFLWAVRTGQFDDKYTPSVRILFDEKRETNISETETKQNRNNDIPGKQKKIQNSDTSAVKFTDKK